MSDAEEQVGVETIAEIVQTDVESVATLGLSEEQPGESGSSTEDEISTESKSEKETEPTDSSSEKEESQGVQKRLDEITRARREAERERDYYRKLAEESQKVEPIKPAKTPVDKTLEDFAYDEGKYQSYLMQTVETRAVEAAKAELERARKQEAVLKKEVAHSEREETYAKDEKDYYRITRDLNFPFSGSMAEISMEMESGPEVTHYLAKNHDISEKIARLPELQQAVEMGKLEERLATQRKQKGPRVSDAPKPAPTLKGVNQKIEKDPADMSVNEFDKWRAKAIANR